MASESDELSESLLYAVAIAGDDGLDRSAFERVVQEFYSNKYGDVDIQDESTPDDLLFSEEPPVTKPTLDVTFLHNAWNTLTAHTDVSVEPSSRKDDIRLVTTNDRVWQAIAGHAPDTSRVKKAEFVLLKVIAKHGAAGIIQPELVRITGQDKRSVPKRTDALAANGYITKSSIIAVNTRTSILKLARFADRADGAAAITVSEQPAQGVIYYDHWFDTIIEMLREYDGLLSLEDLRLRLDIEGSFHYSRALNRCLRRLVEGKQALLRREKRRSRDAPADDADKVTNCLKLLREPTDKDRAAFKKSKKKRKRPKPKVNENDATDYETAEEESADEADVDLLTPPIRPPPQWQPHIPIPNLVYDLVDAAGTTGISSMEIQKRTMGMTWGRPIDEILLRLCDQWKISQPPHLRHLSLIKDIGMERRTHFFLYRTRPNFEKAVAEGAAFWEAIDTEAAKKDGAPVTQTQQPPILDSWGFPIINAKLLAGNQDGAASLVVCEKAAKLPGRVARDAPNGKRKSSVLSDIGSPSTKHVKYVDTEDLAAGNTVTGATEDRETVNLEEDEAPSVNMRQSETATSLDATLPQPSTLCSINPERALQMRSDHFDSTSRATTPLIAVFQLPTLKHLSWFVDNTSRSSLLKRKKSETGLTSTPRKRLKRMLVDDSPASETAQTVIDPASPIEPVQPQVQDPMAEQATSPQSLRTSNRVYPQIDPYRKDAPTFMHGSPSRSIVIGKASGGVAMKRSKAILDILAANGGIYPGGREICKPMSEVLAITTTQLDSATASNAVKDLMRRGKVKKIVFQFYGDDHLLIRKAILAEPHVDPSSPAVATMQARMEAAHPNKYHPGDEDKAPPPKQPPKPPKPRIRVQDLPFVRRSDQGLALLAQRRQEAMAKRVAEGLPPRPLRRARLPKNPEPMSDDDVDEEDFSPEQLALMDKFQIDGYTPRFTHANYPFQAFRSIYPRKQFPSAFKSVQPVEPPRPVKKLVDEDLELPWYDLRTPEQRMQDFEYLARARSMHLMACPPQQRHQRTNTVAPKPVVNKEFRLPPRGFQYRFDHSGWVEVDTEAPHLRARLFPRLQTLDSQIFNTRLNSNSLKGLRSVPGVLRLNRPATIPAIDNTGSAPQPNGIDASWLQTPDASKYATKVVGTKAPIVVQVKKRDRRSPKLFQENDRLVNAVALYRAVVGGLDQRCNWGVIAHMLSFRYEPDFLRRRWDVMKNAREDNVRSMMEMIYKPFLAAYEEGSVPSIDFARLAKTDWAAMLQWLEQSVLAPGGLLKASTYSLPQDADAFFAAYTISEPANFWERSRDSWFTTPVEKTRKDIAHEFVYGTPLPGHSRPTQLQVVDPNLVVKTLIRAIAVTAREKYDSAMAAQKLDGYGDLSEICEEMLANKTLRHVNKGRSLPGRQYEIHDATWAAFRRWPGKDTEWQYLRAVAKAREAVVEALDQEEPLMLNYEASDFEIVVILNMVRQGLLKMTSQLPERNDDFEAPFPKLSAWGYAGYTYNAKTIDRDRLRFPLLIEKTEEYEAEHGLVAGVAVPLQPRQTDGRLPIWVDINGELVPDVWDLVLRSMLNVIVYRTGVGVAAIEDAHTQRLSSWEAELVLDWMQQSKIAEHYGPGRMENGVWSGGWKAAEWWYCAFASDMITWRKQ